MSVSGSGKKGRARGPAGWALKAAKIPEDRLVTWLEGHSGGFLTDYPMFLLLTADAMI
jgi:hypothetical protein